MNLALKMGCVNLVQQMERQVVTWHPTPELGSSVPHTHTCTDGSILRDGRALGIAHG